MSAIARQIKPKPSKLEQQRALLGGAVPSVSTKKAATVAIVGKLPGMIKAAADKLASATDAAAVLEARDLATVTYSTAKISSRIAKAKGAHDKVVAAAHRAQADALEIEAEAKRRLADEYDGAQKRGEVGKKGQRTDLVPEQDKVPTAEEIGMSRKEVQDAREIRDAIKANPGIVKEVLGDILKSGDEPTRAALKKAIAPVVKEVRGEAQAEKKARRGQREAVLAEKIRALPDQKFGVILADPEWKFEPYSPETGMDRAADNHYPTSDLEVIKARPVQSIAADDCVLFLWATAPMMPQALEVMAAWGFAYKAQAVWVKQRAGDGRGTGYWFLGEHELLLVGTRGKIPAPAMGTQVRSVIEAPVGDHSEKPVVVHEIIEAYFPNLPKIELNRRGLPRPGWSAWGAEAVEAA